MTGWPCVVVIAAVIGIGGCDGGRCAGIDCTIHQRSCDATFDCLGDEICDYPDDRCGAGEARGVCRSAPLHCDGEVPPSADPVCGCDGAFHADGCAASLAGTDLDRGGRCTPPPGTFRCGVTACPLAEVCRRFVAGSDELSACVPVPAACADQPTCACIERALPCDGVDTCSGGIDEGFTVECAVAQNQ